MQESYRQALAQGQRIGSRYALSLPYQVIAGGIGAQAGRGVGSSLEFMDHREYQPGDDLRRIDWSAYARSDKLIVNLYREEVNPHLDLILDGSASMNLADSRKARGTLAVAAAFAQAADVGGFSHRSWLCNGQCRGVRNGSDRPENWTGIAFDNTENPAQAIIRSASTFRPRGVRLLISDLLWLGDPLTLLSVLSERATAVYVVQLLAVADADPDLQGNVRLEDTETGDLREVFIDATARAAYLRRLRDHQENWRRACRQSGSQMITLVAESFLQNADLSTAVASGMLAVK